MKRYRLRIGLDVDDILYDCNAYAIELLNKEDYKDIKEYFNERFN